MDNSRRNFLGTLTAAVAAFLSFGGTGAAQGRSVRSGPAVSTLAGDTLSRLGWGSFSDQIGSAFEFSVRGLRRAKRPSRLLLANVKNTDLRPEGLQSEDPQCFVLIFTSRSVQLGQDTYAVSHPVLGGFELFISDAAIIDGEYSYTAVINRVVG